MHSAIGDLQTSLVLPETSKSTCTFAKRHSPRVLLPTLGTGDSQPGHKGSVLLMAECDVQLKG